MKRIAIITTGSEFLQGKKVETNSTFICGELFKEGFSVEEILTVSDETGALEKAVRDYTERFDIVLVTGGLGPTDDDTTVDAVCAVFNRDPVVDEDAYEKMLKVFEASGLDINAFDEKMAVMPGGSVPLENTSGLAPGFILTSGDKTVIAMPGVPEEMREMFNRGVIPFIREQTGEKNNSNFTCRIVGIKESEVNSGIRSSGIPLHEYQWGMTAEEGIKEVTFVKTGRHNQDWGLVKSEIARLFKDGVLLPGLKTPEEELVHLLAENGLTMAAAESCTGGLVGKRITDAAGASSVFMGGIIAYSNSVKVRELAVSEDTLKKHGAVSEETAAEMASGIIKRMGSSYGISITGIAGPGGGTEEKPVGTVSFAIADGKGVTAWTEIIPGDRQRVRIFSSLVIIDSLRRKIRKEYHEKVS